MPLDSTYFQGVLWLAPIGIDYLDDVASIGVSVANSIGGIDGKDISGDGDRALAKFVR